jgi:hypothetical protein
MSAHSDLFLGAGPQVRTTTYGTVTAQVFRLRDIGAFDVVLTDSSGNAFHTIADGKNHADAARSAIDRLGEALEREDDDHHETALRFGHEIEDAAHLVEEMEEAETGYLGASKVRKKKRIPLARAEDIAEDVVAELEPFSEFLMVAGSIRRRDKEIGDVEVVVLPKGWDHPDDLRDFYALLWELGYSGGERKQWRMTDGVKTEVYITLHPDEVGGHVFMYTGDWQFNVAMRNKAKRMGYKLDQYGIWKGDEIVVAGPDEGVFFEFLDVDWHEPEERSLARRTPEERRKRAKKARARKRAKAAMAGHGCPGDDGDDEEDEEDEGEEE